MRAPPYEPGGGHVDGEMGPGSDRLPLAEALVGLGKLATRGGVRRLELDRPLKLGNGLGDHAFLEIGAPEKDRVDRLARVERPRLAVELEGQVELSRTLIGRGE